MALPTHNKQVVLTRYPQGMVEESDMDVVEADFTAVLGEGDVLVRNEMVSLDPYLRNRMSEGKFALGKVIPTFGAGWVLSSLNPNFAVGDAVSGFLALEQYTVVAKGAGLYKVDVTDKLPLSYYVGVLGMPGATAYHGLLKVCEPKEGETVFVSAASGAVGQVVGQIAKKKGCYVVGSAGSDDKVDYLVKELGFDDALNYKTCGDVTEALKKICPQGIDCDFENVGGPILDGVLAVANKGARIAVCGMISQYNKVPDPVHNFVNVIYGRIKIQGFVQSDYIADRASFIRDVTAWLLDGSIKYREDICEGLESAPAQFIKLFTGRNFGKTSVHI